MDLLGKFLCCTCSCDKLVVCLWHLRTGLELEVNSLKNELGRLKGIKEQRRQEIGSKALDGKCPTPKLKRWLERVEKLENDELFVGPEERDRGDDVEHRPPNPQIHPPTTCLGGLCYKNWFDANKYQMRVVYLREEVTKLISEQETFNMDELFVADLGPADLPLGETIGMEEIFNNVWHCLRDKEGTRIIGIHGMAGVGKTTLLKRINNHLRENTNRGYFNQVLWIDGLRGSDVESVQFAIGEKLGLTWGENTSPLTRGTKIKSYLNKKKCLLLIDDLRKRLDFTAVGVPTETKVVFTTGNKAACAVADDTFPLECLREEDAWVLFQKFVGVSTLRSNPKIEPLAREVAQSCGGLPLALANVGSAMSLRTRAEFWEQAKEMLSTHQAPEFAGIDQEVYHVYHKLKVSYELLQNKNKTCFLYCSLFPNVCMVEEEVLILHWFAENLIADVNGALRAILNQGKVVINDLKAVWLLKRDESKGTISMHDMVRGTAKWIASEGGNKFWVEYEAPFPLTELPASTNSTLVEKISLVKCKIEGSMILECPNLSTLILKMSSIPDDFFRPMEKLMLLDLSYCKILVLPDHITSSVNLQYLNLSHTDIKVLPEDFKNLKRLKYLDLSFMNHLQMIPLEVISNLLRLKFLNMYHSSLKGTCRGVLAETGRDLIRELDSLNNLEVLGITIKSEAAFQNLRRSRNKKCTQSLFITSCEELELLELRMNLKVLRVLSCSKLRCVEWSIKQDALHRVDIKDCGELDGLDWLKYACNLRFLRIENCVKMTHIIRVKEMKRKQVVIKESEIESEGESSVEAEEVVCESSAQAEKRTLEIASESSAKAEKCTSEIESESSVDAEERVKRKQVNFESEKHKSLFSELTRLHLENLPLLETICGQDLENCVLEQITVVDCPQLKKLPLGVNSNSKGALKYISGSRKWWNDLQMEERARTEFTRYFRRK